MAVTYGEFGIKPQSSVATGTNVSSVTVDLPNNTGVSFVTGVLAASTESSNFNYRCRFLDSNSTAIAMRYHTSTNSTTNSFYSSNNTVGAFTYWNLGALNSDSTYSGERCNFWFMIDNNLSNTSPFTSPHVVGVGCWSANSGTTNMSDFRAVLRENKNISKVQFFCQSGNLNAHRVRAFSVFES
jgi:hypothetical protein